jgi:hypothetical protein
MKRLGAVCLAFAAMTAVTALAGPPAANATVLCEKRGEVSYLWCAKPYPYNTPMTITMFPGEAVIKLSSGWEARCKRSTMPGNISSNGVPRALIRNSNLTFTECGGCSVASLEAGSLGIDWVGEISHSNVWGSGTVYGSQQMVQISCFGMFSCVYQSPSWTHFGSISSGTFPVIKVNAKLKYVAGSETWCGGSTSSATWTGNYEVVSPRPLYIDRI